MMAWMQNWETWEHYNPGCSWQGQMTVPRELSVKNGRLHQWPIRELKQLRKNPVRYVDRTFTGALQLGGINGRRIDMELSVRPVTGEEPYRKFVCSLMELTAQPPLDTVCPEIVNMVLESMEVHDGGLLYFHFLDGTVLEIEMEERHSWQYIGLKDTFFLVFLVAFLHSGVGDFCSEIRL